MGRTAGGRIHGAHRQSAFRANMESRSFSGREVKSGSSQHPVPSCLAGADVCSHDARGSAPPRAAAPPGDGRVALSFHNPRGSAVGRFGAAATAQLVDKWARATLAAVVAAAARARATRCAITPRRQWAASATTRDGAGVFGLAPTPNTSSWRQLERLAARACVCPNASAPLLLCRVRVVEHDAQNPTQSW